MSVNVPGERARKVTKGRTMRKSRAMMYDGKRIRSIAAASMFFMNGMAATMAIAITANAAGTIAITRVHDRHIHISVCEGKAASQARQWMMPKILAATHSVMTAGPS